MSQKFYVNEKNIDKNMKWKIKCAVSINSIGKLLWEMKLGRSRLVAPINP